MSSRFRYVAIAPGLVDGKHVKAIGPALPLFLFLIDHQTDKDGIVNYGKPISYPWIEDRFQNAPPRRSLRRWMWRLREGEYISVERQEFGDERMIVSIASPTPSTAFQDTFRSPREAKVQTSIVPYAMQ